MYSDSVCVSTKSKEIKIPFSPLHCNPINVPVGCSDGYLYNVAVLFCIY